MLCISINLSYAHVCKYCCHVWVGAPGCYLELLDKLQKRICRTIDPSLAASLEPLTRHRNLASLSLFFRYYFGRCSSELAQLVPLPFSQGRSTCYSDRMHDFSNTRSYFRQKEHPVIECCPSILFLLKKIEIQNFKISSFTLYIRVVRYTDAFQIIVSSLFEKQVALFCCKKLSKPE